MTEELKPGKLRLFRKGWQDEYLWLDGYNPHPKDADAWPVRHGIEIPSYYQTLRFDDMPSPRSFMWFGYSAEGAQRLVAHLRGLDLKRREIFGMCQFPEEVPAGFAYVILREWPNHMQEIVDKIGDRLPRFWLGWRFAYRQICVLLECPSLDLHRDADIPEAAEPAKEPAP